MYNLNPRIRGDVRGSGYRPSVMVAASGWTRGSVPRYPRVVPFDPDSHPFSSRVPWHSVPYHGPKELESNRVAALMARALLRFNLRCSTSTPPFVAPTSLSARPVAVSRPTSLLGATLVVLPHSSLPLSLFVVPTRRRRPSPSSTPSVPILRLRFVIPRNPS